jgi:hypothetical protein
MLLTLSNQPVLCRCFSWNSLNPRKGDQQFCPFCWLNYLFEFFLRDYHHTFLQALI